MAQINVELAEASFEQAQIRFEMLTDPPEAVDMATSRAALNEALASYQLQNIHEIQLFQEKPPSIDKYHNLHHP